VFELDTLRKGTCRRSSTGGFYPQEEGTFEVQIGENRTYILHLPYGLLSEARRLDTKVPLLVVYHGKDETAWFAADNQTTWIDHANEKKFVLVFMQALGDRWSRYSGQTRWTYARIRVDVDYTTSVITELLLDFPIDEKRLYAVGIDNGGFFVVNVALRHSHIFAAVASYMGGYKRRLSLNPLEALRKIPIMFAIGGNDRKLGYALEGQRVFSAVGFPVELRVYPKVVHIYQREREEELWQFLSRYTIDDFNPRNEKRLLEFLPKNKTMGNDR